MISLNPFRVRNSWIISTIILIITLDFKVFSILSYSVTPLLLFLPIWIYRSFVITFKLRVKHIAILVLVSILPFINVGDVVNWLEFWKSYALLIFNIGVLLFCCRRESKINVKTIRIAIILLQYILLVFCIFQLVELFYFSSDYLWDLWGSRSASFTISSWAGRAKGFFHEPSHLAVLSVYLFWMRSMAEQRIGLYNLVLSVGVLLLTRSGAGLMLFPVILIYLLYTYYNHILSFLLIGFFLVIFSFAILLQRDLVLKFIKYDQITNTDKFSSGYMRWVQPIKFINLHIQENRYFGYGLGQMEYDYFVKHDAVLRNSNVRVSAISNGLFSAQLQFGIVFTLFVLYVFCVRYPYMQSDWRSLAFIGFICLTAGSYFELEFYFIRFLLPILLIKSMDNCRRRI